MTRRMMIPRLYRAKVLPTKLEDVSHQGFRKVDTDKWEFANEGFCRGKRHLLKNIQRRRSSTCSGSSSSLVHVPVPAAVGKDAALEEEIERLRKDRSVMMREVIELRGKQIGTVEHMNRVGEKLQAAEKKQKQMVSFLANVFENPNAALGFENPNAALLPQLKQIKHEKQITSPRTLRRFMKHKAAYEASTMPDFDSSHFNQVSHDESIQFPVQDTDSENLAFDAAFGELGLGDEFFMTDSEQVLSHGAELALPDERNVGKDQISEERDVIVNPQKECPLSFDPSYDGLEYIVKEEDLWPPTDLELDTGFGSCTPDLLWGNSDMERIEGSSSGIPDIWGDFGSGIDKWDESSSKDLAP